MSLTKYNINNYSPSCQINNPININKEGEAHQTVKH